MTMVELADRGESGPHKGFEHLIVRLTIIPRYRFFHAVPRPFRSIPYHRPRRHDRVRSSSLRRQFRPELSGSDTYMFAAWAHRPFHVFQGYLEEHHGSVEFQGRGQRVPLMLTPYPWEILLALSNASTVSTIFNLES